MYMLKNLTVKLMKSPLIITLDIVILYNGRMILSHIQKHFLVAFLSKAATEGHKFQILINLTEGLFWKMVMVSLESRDRIASVYFMLSLHIFLYYTAVHSRWFVILLLSIFELKNHFPIWMWLFRLDRMHVHC